MGGKSNSKQYEVNCQVNDVVSDVLMSNQSAVKVSQARDLVLIMTASFKFFKTSFINLVDKILVIEEKDQMIKNVYSLISKFFVELSRS